MTLAVWDEIWTEQRQGSGSVFVVRKGENIKVISKCCSADVYSRAGDWKCEHCTTSLPTQPEVYLVTNWSLAHAVMWDVVPRWIEAWTGIPAGDIELTVDGEIVE